MDSNNYDFPNNDGFFGEYGGKFVPETLMYALEQLESTYKKLSKDKSFLKEIDEDLVNFVG